MVYGTGLPRSHSNKGQATCAPVHLPDRRRGPGDAAARRPAPAAGGDADRQFFKKRRARVLSWYSVYEYSCTVHFNSLLLRVVVHGTVKYVLLYSCTGTSRCFFGCRARARIACIIVDLSHAHTAGWPSDPVGRRPAVACHQPAAAKMVMLDARFSSSLPHHNPHWFLPRYL